MADLLPPFQTEKLEYWFRFLCPNDRNCIDAASIDRYMMKVLDFTGWDEDGAIAKECHEVHIVFFEALLEKAKEMATDGEVVGTEVSMDAWCGLWAHLLKGVMGLTNLPIWARLVPKHLFKMMDRHRKNELSAVDLEHFYRDMVHLEPEEASKISLTAYNAMTDYGAYTLNLDGYETIFANFLIGKSPYGPGRFIFGCFEHEVQPFTLIQPMAEYKEEKIKIKAPAGGRRPSRV